MKLSDIAVLLKADIEGEASLDIARVARIEEAVEGDITFLANPKYVEYLPGTNASAVIVGRDFAAPKPVDGHRLPSLVRVDDPYLSFLKMMLKFQPPRDPLPPGIHPTAVIAPSAKLGANIRIGAQAVVGERCRVDDGAIIGHGTILCDEVVVGSHSLLYHNITVREGCIIGRGVIIHPGATIGSDGFGFAPKPDGSYEKIPQLGIVVIEDDVEIGANCTIDRATLGETRIMKGTKLDNLIQVAHNVVIGENTVIAAQAGISGSAKLGNNVMIGGQVGITGHLKIADGTRIGAQSGIHHSIHEPGQTLFGSPALPKREAFRIQGALTQLPDLITTIRELKETIADLKSRLQQNSSEEKGVHKEESS